MYSITAVNFFIPKSVLIFSAETQNVTKYLNNGMQWFIFCQEIGDIHSTAANLISSIKVVSYPESLIKFKLSSLEHRS